LRSASIGNSVGIAKASRPCPARSTPTALRRCACPLSRERHAAACPRKRERDKPSRRRWLLCSRWPKYTNSCSALLAMAILMTRTHVRAVCRRCFKSAAVLLLVPILRQTGGRPCGEVRAVGCIVSSVKSSASPPQMASACQSSSRAVPTPPAVSVLPCAIVSVRSRHLAAHLAA